MATLQTVRRWIMTGAVAAITITGTIYGAGLKGQQDVKQVCFAITILSSHTEIHACSKNDKSSKPHRKNESHSSKSRAPN